jgi:hypothetical protein
MSRYESMMELLGCREAGTISSMYLGMRSPQLDLILVIQ